MSSRMFQNVILQMKEATDRRIGVIDADGSVVSCTDPGANGEKWAECIIRLSGADEPVVHAGGMTLRPLSSDGTHFEFAVFVDGEDAQARTLCTMAAVALNSARTYYEEKHDKGTFVKNIIMDNILPGDIYIRAKELHFPSEVQRAVFLVRQVGRADVAAVDGAAGRQGRRGGGGCAAVPVPGPPAGFRPLHQ